MWDSNEKRGHKSKQNQPGQYVYTSSIHHLPVWYIPTVGGTLSRSTQWPLVRSFPAPKFFSQHRIPKSKAKKKKTPRADPKPISPGPKARNTHTHTRMTAQNGAKRGNRAAQRHTKGTNMVGSTLGEKSSRNLVNEPPPAWSCTNYLGTKVGAQNSSITVCVHEAGQSVVLTHSYTHMHSYIR